MLIYWFLNLSGFDNLELAISFSYQFFLEEYQKWNDISKGKWFVFHYLIQTWKMIFQILVEVKTPNNADWCEKLLVVVTKWWWAGGDNYGG